MLKNRIVIIFFFSLCIIVFLYDFSCYKQKVINKIELNNYYDSLNRDSYFGILKIPGLGIDNVIYNENDVRNNVNKNIYIVENRKNIIVLAAHSGDSSISYFKNLHKLDNSYVIKLLVDNRIRTYKLFKKEEVLKTGKVKITNYKYPILILITCSKTKYNVQDVYYSRLVKSANFDIK